MFGHHYWNFFCAEGAPSCAWFWKLSPLKKKTTQQQQQPNSNEKTTTKPNKPRNKTKHKQTTNQPSSYQNQTNQSKTSSKIANSNLQKSCNLSMGIDHPYLSILREMMQSYQHKHIWFMENHTGVSECLHELVEPLQLTWCLLHLLRVTY